MRKVIDVKKFISLFICFIFCSNFFEIIGNEGITSIEVNAYSYGGVIRHSINDVENYIKSHVYEFSGDKYSIAPDKENFEQGALSQEYLQCCINKLSNYSVPTPKA